VKFRFIQAQRETFAVGQLCRVLKVSRSGFYSWSSRPQSERDQQNAALLQRIHAVHRENRGVYGSPRVYRALRAAGHRAGRHRVARLMRLEGLRGRGRTALSLHRHPPQRFPRGPQPRAPKLPSRRTQSSLGRRHHTDPHSSGLALLGRPRRRLLSACRRLGHRRSHQSRLNPSGFADRPTIPSARAGARSSQRSGLSVRWRRLPGASRPLRHPLQHEPLW
jgi:HTH-like domain